MRSERLQAVAAAALVAAIAAGLAGCASTNIRSQVAPDYAGAPFEHILVWIDLQDPMTEQQAEEELVEELDARGVTATPHYEVFFAGREYTFEERRKELDRNEIDAVLTLTVTDAGATTRRVPPTRDVVHGVNPYTGRVHRRTRWYPGYVDVETWADFRAELMDRTDGELVWLAFAQTAGDPSVGSAGFAQSVTREVARQLVSDGIVRSN